MRKPLFSGQKWFLMPYLLLIGGTFELKSGIRFSFWAPYVPELRVRKMPLSLSLRNTKGGKSGFRPHGAIIHWSGIFEPSERSPGVLGRITQDNVFQCKVQQSSFSIPGTLLNCRNYTKSTEVRRTCRWRRRTNRKWGIMPPTKNLW